ncbi:hypothetical protein ULMS_10470 [Patiriisocius marinistellae]|uniref:T9SS type A sorting domain-containing protein n=1 Tax=Patiriisocius marinistellae TaxID=2494560 RepID=A0A5J4FZD6_9FLAO|nr:FG-GAP-like repeat-containing protein [Patiriisocius marinistellae]GEQ85539.1 hypothetical protein ULMS_10470 [Patiriisocius marinistellae]
MKNLITLITIICLNTVVNAQDVTFTEQTITPTNLIYGISDVNGDYLDDIIIPKADNLFIYHQSTAGTLEMTTIPTTVTHGAEWSLAVADYDNNGINDLMYGAETGVSFLQANVDGTAFTENDTSTTSIFCQRGNFIDINNDGFIDGFMCNDESPNNYFINDGTGNFLPDNQGGIGDTPGGGNYGSIWFDYDGDKDMDVYISKCIAGGGTGPTDPRRVDQLHRNNGDGTFTDVAPAAGVDLGVQSWSTATGDFDNDGDMDLVVADQHNNEIGTKLMINNGDGTFTDMTMGSGFEGQDQSVTIVAFDFNNDGFIDIYAEFGQGIFLNNGDLTFTQNTTDILGRGTVGDINNDGFLDIKATTTDKLLVNNGNSNNYLTLNLKGIESNPNGIGAIITITGDFGTQVRHVQSGIGFLQAHTLNPHFGLGDAAQVTSVLIEWPSGVVDFIENVSVNEALFVEEGSNPILGISEISTNTTIELFPIPATTTLSINTSEILKPKARITSLLGVAINANIQNNTVNIQSLASGTYFLILETENGQRLSKKFVKE